MIEAGGIVQLRGPTPPYPPTKNMTTPSSCPAHKRNAKKRERTRTVWPPPTHLQKAHAHYAPHHIIPLPPPTLSFPKIFISAKAQTSRQDRVMPPRRTRQPPTHNLSWFSTPQRQVVLHQVHGLIDERDRRDRRRLERFRHHIRAHDIPYFCASLQV